ncbi:MAG: hypothetical protein IKV51_05650 [Clostridia bacterium]|nr:hypothetical protein [Clostridia bacterium]
MKKLLALILALALAAGMYAVFAEGGSDSEAAGTPAAAEETVTEETGADKTQTAETDESAALKEAWKAYREAKKAAKLEAFEEELKLLVEAGKLTQEQADLLIRYAGEGKLPGWKDKCDEVKGKSSSGSGKSSRGRGKPSGSSGSGSSESEKSESADAKSPGSGKKSSGGSRSGKNR